MLFRSSHDFVLSVLPVLSSFAQLKAITAIAAILSTLLMISIGLPVRVSAPPKV